MDNPMVFVFGDICSEMGGPRRIELVGDQSGTDVWYNVDRERPLETTVQRIYKDQFLQSHPELAIVMTKMKVGDVATREDTTCGVRWVIKDKNGVVLYTIPVKTATSGI